MNSIFGLMATSGGNFVSIAPLRNPLTDKNADVSILIFPTVYINIEKNLLFLLESNHLLFNHYQGLRKSNTSHL